MTTETADLELCRRAVASGLVPRGLTAEQAYLSLLAGRELGLSDVQSLRLVQAIEGRISLTAQAMGGLLQRAGGVIIWHETSDTVADVEIRFNGSVRRTRWTIDMAKRAGLAGRGTWSRYPMAMLSARALSDACRYAAPSVLAGVYDPEELASIPQEPAPSPRTMLGEARPETRPEPRQLVETIDARPEPEASTTTTTSTPEPRPEPLPESRKLAYMRRLADLDLISEAIAVLGDPTTWTAETSSRIGPVVRDLQASRDAARLASRGEE
jgi:hypothetical protein